MATLKLQENVEIKGYRDIEMNYRLIHKAYLSSQTKPVAELREWMSLISFLKKNRTRRCKIISLQYPFSIIKNERPDFILLNNNGDEIHIEIVKIISKNMAAILSLSNSMKEEHMVELDSSLYDDNSLLKKSDFHRLIVHPGEILQSDGIYGHFAEYKWAELCYKAIKMKSNKTYQMDILLLDDQHVNSNDRNSICTGLGFLRSMLKENPICVDNMSYIISENQSGLILLYKQPNWLCLYKQYENAVYEY